MENYNGLPAFGTLDEASAQWEAFGLDWPVSGDATAVMYGGTR